MQYDLEMITDLCDELSLPHRSSTPNEVLVELEPGVELVFVNWPDKDDCLMGIAGTDWHTHGGLTCADRHGHYIELTYLDVLTGLADGTILLCEMWRSEGLADRWIGHKDFLDGFRYMEIGEEIRVRPVGSRESSGE